MLSKINLTNIKCFEQLELSLGNLTLLSGMNSMGKSTVIQALLLLRNSYEKGLLNKGIFLNNDYTQIGVGKDLLNSGAATDDPFQIGIEDNNKFTWNYNLDDDEDEDEDDDEENYYLMFTYNKKNKEIKFFSSIKDDYEEYKKVLIYINNNLDYIMNEFYLEYL